VVIRLCFFLLTKLDIPETTPDEFKTNKEKMIGGMHILSVFLLATLHRISLSTVHNMMPD